MLGEALVHQRTSWSVLQQEGLKKLQKKLMVRTGSLLVESSSTSGANGKESSASSQSSSSSSGPSSPAPSGALRENLAKGKMFKKFFQNAEEEDEAGSSLAREESQLDDRGIDPDELWGSIKALLKQTPLDVPEMSQRLAQLNSLLDRELRSLQSQHSNVAWDGSKPHVKACVANFESVKQCLAAAPRQVTVQYNAQTQVGGALLVTVGSGWKRGRGFFLPLVSLALWIPRRNPPLPQQEAVGSHRVGAAEAVALLLGPNNIALDKAIAAAKLAPMVTHLSLAHPLCST